MSRSLVMLGLAVLLCGAKDLAPSWDRDALDHNIRAYINSRTQTAGGYFEIEDRKAGKKRKLTLEKLHPSKVVPQRNGTASVRGDFRDKNGDKVQVLFYVGAASEVKGTAIR